MNLPRRQWLLLGGVASLLGALLLGLGLCRTQPPPSDLPPVERHAPRISGELASQLHQLEQRERELDATVWAPEQQAQQRGRTFETLWNTLRSSPNPWPVLASFPVYQVILPANLSRTSLPWNLTAHLPQGPGRRYNAREWHQQLHAWADQGWRLDRWEFRHQRFQPATHQEPARSDWFLTVHATHPERQEAVSVEGVLGVVWSAESFDPSNPPAPATIQELDGHRLIVKSRSGPPAFEEILSLPVPTPPHGHAIDPLIVQDLDHDGHAEILWVGANRLWRGPFTAAISDQPLLLPPGEPRETAVLADFDGDGHWDLLVARRSGLDLHSGDGKGGWTPSGRRVWTAGTDWQQVQVLTAGDVDGDGDPDVFAGQYRPPYEAGSMPTPYHDARDGYPAYLWLNDGQGGLTEVTVAAGLAEKRRRRIFSASFVDLDRDGDLDLVVVSDFAGVDFHRNNGRGHFEDLTATWTDHSRAFGMAHALSDFNQDGHLDLLMMGMPSWTVRRLEHLDLWHPDDREHRRWRAEMTQGNRLYLARTQPAGFLEEASTVGLSDTGWSWGVAVGDADRDGSPEVFVANGMESRHSVEDYESHYWLHDAHLAGSPNESAAYLYFQSKFARTRARGMSYGGFEINRFLVQQPGKGWIETAHLVGLARQEDARNVVAADLDGDGSLEWLVTTFEPWPNPAQRLRIYRVRPEVARGHWIGFRLIPTPGAPSLLGVQVRIRQAGVETVRTVVAGDSYRSQGPAVVHFGLGHDPVVESAEIQWPQQPPLVLPTPEVDRYHRVLWPVTTGPPN